MKTLKYTFAILFMTTFLIACEAEDVNVNDVEIQNLADIDGDESMTDIDGDESMTDIDGDESMTDIDGDESMTDIDGDEGM